MMVLAEVEFTKAERGVYLYAMKTEGYNPDLYLDGSTLRFPPEHYAEVVEPLSEAIARSAVKKGSDVDRVPQDVMLKMAHAINEIGEEQRAKEALDDAGIPDMDSSDVLRKTNFNFENPEKSAYGKVYLFMLTSSRRSLACYNVDFADLSKAAAKDRQGVQQSSNPFDSIRSDMMNKGGDS